MTTMTVLAQQQKEKARAAFLEAVWANAPVDQLAELARAAHLEPAEADLLVARIADVRADIQVAEPIVKLRRAAAKAKAHYESARVRTAAAIEKLEAEADAAAFESIASQKSVTEADSAARRVLAAFDDGLLPSARVPQEVLALIERREHEQRITTAHSRMIAAWNERTRARGSVAGLEARLRNLPISNDQQQQAARLRAELDHERAALAAAERDVAEAERAHDKAKNA
jgi:hypothetical protein